MEESYTRVLNAQTSMLARIEEEGTDVAVRLDAVDEGVKVAIDRIDKDLNELDERVNRRKDELRRLEETVDSQKELIALLEQRSKTQRGMIEDLMSKVDRMEDRLCHCGKDKAASSAGDSPYVLDPPVEEERTIEDLYYTPPSSSNALVVYDSDPAPPLVDADEENKENEEAIPVPPPVLNLEALHRLAEVRLQRAFRTKGPPREYHPYRRTPCCILAPRDSTHRRGPLCSTVRLPGPLPESRRGSPIEGWGS